MLQCEGFALINTARICCAYCSCRGIHDGGAGRGGYLQVRGPRRECSISPMRRPTAASRYSCGTSRRTRSSAPLSDSPDAPANPEGVRADHQFLRSGVWRGQVTGQGGDPGRIGLQPQCRFPQGGSRVSCSSCRRPPRTSRSPTRFDPSDNIRGGVRYLRFLLDTFKGDVSLALAAYNAGLSRVAQYGGIPPYRRNPQLRGKVLSYQEIIIRNNCKAFYAHQVRSDASHPHKSIWNIPNILTMLRIALIPVHGGALSPLPSRKMRDSGQRRIFAVASVTDWLDGYLARRMEIVTTFGKFLDPIADKLIVMAALVMILPYQRVPAWMVLVILGREIIITGLRGTRLHGRDRHSRQQSGQVQDHLPDRRHPGAAAPLTTITGSFPSTIPGSM